MSFARLLTNFPMGVFVGSILGFSIYWLLDEISGGSLPKEWAIFISSFVTLFGSGLALAGVIWNIRNQNEKLEFARLAKLASAKAVLPLAISKAHEVATQGIELAFADAASYKDPARLEGAKLKERLKNLCLSARSDILVRPTEEPRRCRNSQRFPA